MTQTFVSQTELEAQLDHILASPRNHGTVTMLVVRREVDHREIRSEVYFSPEGGVEGDRWARTASKDPEAEAQLVAMNDRILRLIADQDAERMALAGDQLVIDLNLSEDNVPAGTRFQIGEAVLEVTPKRHKGCKKFAARFGAEALKFINAVDKRDLHLRGIYFRVVQAGLVRVGDPVQKL